MQREPVQLHEPPPREDRGHVEVEPPQRRDDDEPERGRHELSGAQLEAGADADCDDRLAERDQDDQPVPFCEVLGRDSPAATHADHDRAEVVDRKCGEPESDPARSRRRRSRPRSVRDREGPSVRTGRARPAGRGRFERRRRRGRGGAGGRRGTPPRRARRRPRKRRGPRGRRRTWRPSRRARPAGRRPRRRRSRSSATRRRSSPTRARRGRAAHAPVQPRSDGLRAGW